MFLIQQPPHPCDSKQQQQPMGEKPPLGSPMSGLALPSTGDPSCAKDGGEDLGTRRGRGEDLCDSVQMERLVVILLIQTIMWSHH